MSRNNVFKLSGNMALGSNDNYPSNDFDNIKNSLKLLKSKQPQKRSDLPLEQNNLYGGSYSSNAQQRQPPSSKNVPQEYQNYNYQPNRQQQSNSYKDAHYQMEQAYQNEYPTKPPSKPKRIQEPEDILSNERLGKNQNQKLPPRQPEYRQPPQKNYREEIPRGGNGIEQRSIKEVNRDNRVQQKQYDPSELILCSEGCGRKFNPDSINKHEGICRKVFQKKRKEFNAQEQRIVTKDQVKLMKRGELIQKKMEEKKAKEKVPKWKAESLQLRAGIKQSKDDDYAPSKEEQKILEQARNLGMVKCQFCGRSFNEQAGAKHIPFCESQMRKNQMKRR